MSNERTLDTLDQYITKKLAEVEVYINTLLLAKNTVPVKPR